MQAYDLQPTGADPLVGLSELGPGYQLVTFQIGNADFRAGDYIAFNAELLVNHSDFILFLQGADSNNPLKAFETFADFKASIVPKPKIVSSLPSPPLSTSLPAPWPTSPTLVATSTAKANEIFWRVSSVNPDRRIRGGNLVPGTYVTGNGDFAHLTTGFGNVGRYALPTPFPAGHLFKCIAAGGEVLHAGTARPNFGQAGGGVEILFPSASGISAAYYIALPAW